MPTAAKLDLPLFCTFCRKSSDEVARLLAGPGVYICDACVACCNDILADQPGVSFDDGGHLDDQALLARHGAAASSIAHAEEHLRAAVAELRERAVSWARIGDALGITRQAAWDRFSGEE